MNRRDLEDARLTDYGTTADIDRAIERDVAVSDGRLSKYAPLEETQVGRCISWEELRTGQWTAEWCERPCAPSLFDAGRLWPAWRAGSPPTWREVLTADALKLVDRCWLVTRVLVRDRLVLVAWVADCAELAAPHTGANESEVRAVIAALRSWCAGESVDLGSVCRRAYRAAVADGRAAYRYAATAAYHAAAAAESAANYHAAESADEASWAAYYAADVAYTYADAVFLLAIPYLERVAGGVQ